MLRIGKRRVGGVNETTEGRKSKSGFTIATGKYRISQHYEWGPGCIHKITMRYSCPCTPPVESEKYHIFLFLAIGEKKM